MRCSTPSRTTRPATRSPSRKTPRSTPPSPPSTKTPWQSIAYTRGGQAQVAESTITTSARSRSRKPRTLRLIVRRTRLVGAQAELWPNWRHHAFITDRDDHLNPLCLRRSEWCRDMWRPTLFGSRGHR